MSESFYKLLGGVSVGLLFVAVALSIWVLTSRHSKRVAVLVSGSVLAILLTITFFCMVIYSEYHV